MRLNTAAPVFLLALLLLIPSPATAQGVSADSADVASPEAIVAALYASLARAPGQNFDWDRFRSLHHPRAILMPNPEQTGGPMVFAPEEYIALVDDYYEKNAPIGSEKDLGFAEEPIFNEVRRYGDIANVFSSYQKHYWGSDQILGEGINSFQLVFRENRWWIVSVVWDETYAAGPLPDGFGQ